MGPEFMTVASTKMHKERFVRGFSLGLGSREAFRA
jgi:hypothetical protein